MEPIQYEILNSFWRTNLGSQTAEERGIVAAAVAPRTHYLISLVLVVFHEGDPEAFDRTDDNVKNFVAATLDCPKNLISAVSGRRNIAKNRLKIFVDFRAPFELQKQTGFYTATLHREYSTHNHQRTFLCRLEQPKLEEYLEVGLYNEFMLARYNVR